MDVSTEHFWTKAYWCIVINFTSCVERRLVTLFKRKQDRLYILHCALLNSIQITNKFIQYQKLWLVCWFCKHVCTLWTLLESLGSFQYIPSKHCSHVPVILPEFVGNQKHRLEKSSYTDFANELVRKLCSKLCWFRWHLHVSACQYSAKFQVDVKKGGGGLT